MPATDSFASAAPSLDGPADDGEVVTPHDTNELAQVSRGLYVGGAGSVALVTRKGTALTFVGVAAGTVLPVRAREVKSTGTTATGIIALH